MVYTVRLRGIFDLNEEDVLKFHPWIKHLLEEIRNKGLRYKISNIDAEVLVELDFDKLTLNLKYYPPRIEEFEEEGTYEISAELGSEPPAFMKILSVEYFEIEILTKHGWYAVKIDPFGKRVKGICDVLWDFGKEGPNKLAEAKEVYEIAKWFIEEKGFKLADDYVTRTYKKLVDLFEKPYKFTITLELTVKDINMVPSWEELKRDLCNFFHERGLLVELKKDEKDLFNLFKKPIP